eukprot:3987686-Pyramimonas_sp.AAC.1
MVANAKHGKELLEKLAANVRARAEAQAEVNRLTSPPTATQGAASGSASPDDGKPAGDSVFGLPGLSAEDV